MSLLNGRVNFKVQASNISSVASFISELDKASIVLSPNNCNDIYYDSANKLVYSYDTSTHNKAISLDIYENGQVIKPIVLSDEKIFFNSNVYIDGSLIPTQNIINDLGSSNYLWKDIYLSGHTITIGDTKLSSKSITGEVALKTFDGTSNVVSTLTTNRFNMIPVLNVSNFSSIVCQDDGIRLEYLDSSSNIIKSVPLGVANTSVFAEGSNKYYTVERYEGWFSSKNNTDFIKNGTSNKYIINDLYDGDLNVMKALTIGSNIIVSGDTTVIDTIVYQMDNMYISNSNFNTTLSITQNSPFDILKISNSNNTALFIANNTFTGINNETPNFNLDVSGTLNANTFFGETSLFNNLNLYDKSTSHLIEDSNLYFTHHRVDEIVTTSNILSSNYLVVSSNIISVIMTETSNVISDRLTDTSNVISDRLTDTSNVISDRLTETSNLISDRLTDTSNVISNRFTETSNVISDRIFLLNTDIIPENVIPNNLYYTSNRYDERLLSKTLDDFYDGTSNRYIINNTYNSDLNLNGSLYASNLNVAGSITSLSTYTFQTESMTISTDSDHDVSVSIHQLNTSNSQILTVTNIDGDGLYVFTCNLNENHKGFVGINQSTPAFELDVNGVVRSTVLQGDTSQMYNVNLSSINTSYLKEAPYNSNLYFTHERAGAIVLSSNIDTYNYTANSFTDISLQFATDSNILYTTLNNDNTTINTRITNLNTNEIAENPANIYYTTQRYDDRLRTKTSDFIHDGTSNKFVINHTYVGDLSITSNLYASNLNIVGNTTVFNTTTYLTSNLNINTNDYDTLPSLKIRQNGIYDIFELVGDNETVLKIKNGGNVGIMTSTPVNTLDVNGIVRSSQFIGDASQEFLVNLVDRDTGLLPENPSSNLWYTAQRTGELLYSSNNDASNYMIYSHNNILNKTMQTSNILSESLNNLLSVRIANTCNTLIQTSNQVYNMTYETSNTIVNVINNILEIQIVDTNHKLLNMATIAENNVIFTSNLLKTYLDNVVSISVNNTSQKLLNDSNYLMTNIYDTSNLISQTLDNIISVQIRDINKFVDDSSNQLNSDILTTSNFNAHRIFSLSTSEILETDNLYFNDTNFTHCLTDIRTLDNITSNDNTSNKYIINDVYNSSLEIGGSLLVSNLSAVGAFTTLNTNVFQTENMIIDSSTEGPALKITQTNADNNIFETYDDNDVVMMINKDGLIGIKTDSPEHDLDILGTLNTTYIAGDASMSSNIYLVDRNTSMLEEGSNLYYTAFRTGTILYSSNQNASNYTLNTSNDISNRLTMTSNVLREYIQNVSNITAYDITAKSIVNNGSLGKFDYMYYTEKLTSNMMSIFGNSIISYNTSNLVFLGGNVGTGDMSIVNSTKLQFDYKFESDTFLQNSGLLGNSYNLVNVSNIQPLLADKVSGTSSVEFTNTSNILYTPSYNFNTTFNIGCTISFWLKKTGLNTSNDTVLSGYDGTTVNDSLVIRRDNTSNSWYYNIFGNSSTATAYITQISGGAQHSLFLHNSGIVYSCGRNTSGQLGIDSITNLTTLKQVLGENGTGFITGITQISGGDHSMFLHNTGTVYACGNNGSGQLGINSTTASKILKQVLGENGSGFITGITQISGRRDCSLFLHNTGIVYSCGRNHAGQLGINSLTNSTTLKQVLGVDGTGFITGIAQVSSSGFHSLFLHNSGVVYVCGANGQGQLGINLYADSWVLKQVLGVNGFGFITGITQVSCGIFHSLFLHNSGIVYSCGRNIEGQLGINSATNSSVLQQVLGENGTGFITDISQVYSGDYHSLFLHNTGIVYSCGQNSDGQLGLGHTTSPIPTLKQVLGIDGLNFINNITKISCGLSHSLFLQNTGKVYLCGWNTSGQLGLGNTTSPVTTLKEMILPSTSVIVLPDDYIADNTWAHYAWVTEKLGTQTKISIYKNASLLYTNTTGTWTPPNTSICLSSPISSNTLIGNIDDFKIYNTVLTSNEIYSLYNPQTPSERLINLRYDAYTLTSNIPEIEATTTAELNAYFVNTSNTLLNNFNSRTYSIDSTSNDIAIYNTLTSNKITTLILNNSNTFASDFFDTSNLLTIYSELTSNNLAIGIRTASNILQEYSILTSNQYNTHNTISSNYILNYLNVSSNTLSANITYTDITTTEHLIYSSNTNATNYIYSSNQLAGFWSNVAEVSMNDMVLASNTLAPIIQDNSNIISNRIQKLTLDEIYDGSHHQYIVNNVFNSNLNIPHNLIVASLHVQDIDMYMTSDNHDIPNQQLRDYVTEVTSNAIKKFIQERQ